MSNDVKNPGPLALDDPEDNLTALIKLQADISGNPILTGFPGQAWGWIPGEGHRLLFNTYGIGASKVEKDGDDWKFFHREALYYTDPKTGDVLETWDNPYTEKKVEVLHILNDPVNRLYKLKGGFIEPPYPYITNGPYLVFQISVLRAEKNPMQPNDYPIHSQQSIYQSAELWAVSGLLNEIHNPEVTNAANHTAWTRISMWLPFMEMGNRSGQMVYHSQSFKLDEGADSLPDKVRAYTEKCQPQYLEPPSEWLGMAQNANTWTVSKKEIDRRRKAGLGGEAGAVFAVG